MSWGAWAATGYLPPVRRAGAPARLPSPPPAVPGEVSRDGGVLALSWGVPGHRRKEEKGFFVPKRKSCGAAKQNGGGIFEMLQESKPAARGELQGHPAAPMISPMPRLVLLPRGGEAAEG